MLATISPNFIEVRQKLWEEFQFVSEKNGNWEKRHQSFHRDSENWCWCWTAISSFRELNIPFLGSFTRHSDVKNTIQIKNQRRENNSERGKGKTSGLCRLVCKTKRGWSSFVFIGSRSEDAERSFGLCRNQMSQSKYSIKSHCGMRSRNLSLLLFWCGFGL